MVARHAKARLAACAVLAGVCTVGRGHARASDPATDSLWWPLQIASDDQSYVCTPWLPEHDYRVSVWPRVKAEPRFGLCLGAELSALHRTRPMFGCAAGYQWQQTTGFVEQWLHWRLWSGASVSSRASEAITWADGRLEVSLEAALQRYGEDSLTPWLSCELGVTRGQFMPSPSIPVRDWSTGQYFLFHGRLGLERSVLTWGGIWRSRLAISQRATAPFGVSDFSYRQTRVGVVVENNRCLWWFRAGWTAGTAPRQSRFDLATDGPCLNLRAWQAQARDFYSTGLEASCPLVTSLRLLVFTTVAALPAPHLAVWEAGPGLGVARAIGLPHSAWQMRIDFPWIYTGPPRSGATFDLRRIALRVFSPPGVEHAALFKGIDQRWVP